MKTREEINQMFKDYESKWGPLGHTNIMKPEGRKEMKHGVDMSGDFYSYRKKVYEGKQKNALAHTSVIDVEELNARYQEDLEKRHAIIHAGNQNFKYYQKIDLGNGQSRYFYTKEEWDAYQNEKNGKKQSTGAAEKVRQMHDSHEPNVKGMVKDGIVYEKGEDGKFHKTDKTWDEMRKQAIEEGDNEIIKAAKEGGYEAAKKAIFNDERMEEMFTQFEGGFENHGWELNKDGSITGMDDDDEKYFKEMETWLRGFKNSTGIDIYKNPDFQKSVMDEITKRYNLMKNQAKEKESIKNGTKKYAAPEGTAKKSEEKKAENTKTESNSGSDFDKKLNDTITNEGSDATADYIINNSPEFKAYANALRKAVADGKIKVYRDGGMTGKENKELASTFDPLLEDLDVLLQKAAKNPDFDRKGVEKLINQEFENIAAAATEDKYGVRDNTKKFVKHSITYSNPVDEYKEYMERVNKGKEKNKLAHTSFISPEELNARYQKDLEDSCILVHSTNFKYYNKIDLGNGNIRYFYTKAEWDAYQKGKAAEAGMKDAERRRQDPAYAKKQAALEENYKKNKAGEEGMKEAERRRQDPAYDKLKKSLEENYRKNKEAAMHEGDRWMKADSKSNTKPSEVLEENKTEEATKNEQDDFFKKEHTDYVQKNVDKITNEYNQAAEDEHNVSLQIDEKYGFNKAKNDDELAKCWDTLVRDMYQVAQTIDNPDKCYMNFWSDENGAGWNVTIPEFEQWSQEYQKEIDKVFNQAQNASNFDDMKKYGDLWESMNEELRVRTLEAKTKTIKMVTKLKKECLK